MKLPYELEDINCFLQIARAGSMSRAAAANNLPKATLSHHLRRLEDALQVELFVRKPKGLELTDAGREYLNHCSAIFDSCENAASAAQRAHSTISGRVRLIASSEFGTTINGAAAHYFALANPAIDFELQMYSNDRLIGGELNFDCMIFVGEPPDSSLLRRKMGEVSYGLYASPNFVRKYGRPNSVHDVKRFNGAVYSRNGIPEQWSLYHGRKFVQATPYEKFHVNEYWMAKYFSVEGSAIGYLPDFFVNYEIASGALIPVLPAWRSKKTPAYAIYPAQRHRNPRILKLVDMLCKHFDEFIRYPGYSLVKTNYDLDAKMT